MDFLTFKAFISPIMLILFYYLGAIVMPILVWFFSRWLMKKMVLPEEMYQQSKKVVWSNVRSKYKFLFLFLFTTIFLFIELLWRMIFEFLIAYMQIWEALVCTT